MIHRSVIITALLGSLVGASSTVVAEETHELKSGDDKVARVRKGETIKVQITSVRGRGYEHSMLGDGFAGYRPDRSRTWRIDGEYEGKIKTYSVGRGTHILMNDDYQQIARLKVKGPTLRQRWQTRARVARGGRAR